MMQTRGKIPTRFIFSLALILVIVGVVGSTVFMSMRAKQFDTLRPKNYSSKGIDLAEMSLVRKLGSPNVFRPREDLPVWDASLPINWRADPFEDRNWQFQLHAWRTMDYFLHEYKKSRNIEHLKGALAVVLDWEDFHVEKQKRSVFQWYDHATGIRAQRLAFLVDKSLSGELEVDETDLARLMRLVDLHVEKLREPEFLANNNHAIFQLVGLDALCEVAFWRRVCNDARSYASSAFEELLRTQFTEEGVHTESSPTYHLWVLDWIRKSGAAGRFGKPWMEQILNRADSNTSWLTYPNGKWIRVGDSNGTGPQLKSIVNPVCLADKTCWAVRDLSKSGYANIRSLPETPLGEASQLFISAMGKLTGHKHADDLSFVLMNWGREIFVDSGKYGYNRDAARRYVISARAHNVPSLGSVDIAPKHLNVKAQNLGPIETRGSQFIIGGSIERPWKFRHNRTFFYGPGRFLQIKDLLFNQTSIRWLSHLHLAPDLVPEPTKSGFTVRVGIHVVEVEFEGKGCELRMTRGEVDPYQGWVSRGYLKLVPAYVVSADCPADLIESWWRIKLNSDPG